MAFRFRFDDDAAAFDFDDADDDIAADESPIGHGVTRSLPMRIVPDGRRIVMVLPRS